MDDIFISFDIEALITMGEWFLDSNDSPRNPGDYNLITMLLHVFILQDP